MSILTDHTAEVGTPEAGFDMFASREYVAPRANLLPPEIAERAALRKITAAMIAAVVACGGIVGAVYVSTESGKAPANQALADAKAQHATLAAEQAKLAPSQLAHQQVLTAKQSLVAATSSEVLWSNQLNTLRSRLTAGVWLSTLTVTQSAAGGSTATAVTLPAGPANSTATTPAAGAAATATTIAGISLTGEAESNYVLADYLDALSSYPGWSGVYLSTSTADATTASSDAGLVKFAITANITDAALSHRYTNGS